MSTPGQLYVVNEASVQQMSRIRQHLNKYQNAFLAISYIDGTGKVVDSAYDIWINLCLITSKVRPAFMIQWIDYLDPNIFERIMSLLIDYRDSLEDQDIDYRLLFITDPQGVIVTTYYSYYKNNLRKILADYSSYEVDFRSTQSEIFNSMSEDDRADLLLGVILGYPAAGEISLEPHDIEYLSRNERLSVNPIPAFNLPGRYTFSLFIITYGLRARQFLSNIYRTTQSRDKLYDFYNKVVTAVKVYDRESVVLVEDSQGSLVPEAVTYRPSSVKLAEVTPEMKKVYKTYIKDTARLEKNWNDNFDRIFEMGYQYNNHVH